MSKPKIFLTCGIWAVVYTSTHPRDNDPNIRAAIDYAHARNLKEHRYEWLWRK